MLYRIHGKYSWKPSYCWWRRNVFESRKIQVRKSCWQSEQVVFWDGWWLPKCTNTKAYLSQYLWFWMYFHRSMAPWWRMQRNCNWCCHWCHDFTLYGPISNTRCGTVYVDQFRFYRLTKKMKTNHIETTCCCELDSYKLGPVGYEDSFRDVHGIQKLPTLIARVRGMNNKTAK